MQNCAMTFKLEKVIRTAADKVEYTLSEGVDMAHVLIYVKMRARIQNIELAEEISKDSNVWFSRAKDWLVTAVALVKQLRRKCITSSWPSAGRRCTAGMEPVLDNRDYKPGEEASNSSAAEGGATMDGCKKAAY